LGNVGWGRTGEEGGSEHLGVAVATMAAVAAAGGGIFYALRGGGEQYEGHFHKFLRSRAQVLLDLCTLANLGICKRTERGLKGVGLPIARQDCLTIV
jgi:hypothetical protein